MRHEPMIIAATSDLAGKMRGKAFAAHEFEKRLKRGVGWTPTNVQITCFDVIAESPYGALGDLVLIPDPSALVRADFGDDGPAEQFVIGDILTTSGEPWECCTRSILKQALARLEKATGLQLKGAFEHEFQFVDGGCPPGSAYTTAGFRAERVFAETLFSIFGEAGLKADTFMKEYGADQYEVTIGPSTQTRIADQAAIVRELVQETAARLGRRASFTPLRDPAGVGNGVHIHLSLQDSSGAGRTWDANGPYGLSAVAGQFIAGVLKYLDRIVALTAPSVVSYTRLTPHRWSAAFNNLGFRDREASVRICPTSDLSDVDPAEQFNFEFRAGDAAASPYLALAAIIHAGVQGVEEGLECPKATEEDLSLLSADDLASRGFVRLPQTLVEALDRFSSDEIVTGWFPGAFADVYRQHKLGEMKVLEGKTEAEICKAYEEVY
ncbi:glutamine synthetase family protein [Hoeflea sp. WL0058]|uniref:Glutamine synthetase family protein n=1 Tax=Flavimaribacter sediminis TaxID=2865987 RepID=A0AAE2ZMJ0_9HYPH|nr:glutamine synthetase family protein [Flavimaribacter sediminis]MBW8637395.1 glutamine synthetase family protein [Flavimaribacter sediminis]